MKFLNLLDIKYMGPISFAMIIDGLQAGISFALAGFMGTIGASIGAAIWCNQNLPGWTWAQGLCVAAGGAAGTAANPVLIPLGVAIGFVINICLSLTLGSALIALLVMLFGWEPLKKWLSPGFIGDMIPGINNLPFWTFTAVAVSWTHAKQTAQLHVARKIISRATTPAVQEKSSPLPVPMQDIRPAQQNVKAA